jgi:hypothetical protein
MPRWVIDAGHAWLVVELADYPHALNFGTGYGYMDDSRIYLEEDVEAVAFLEMHPEILSRHLDSCHYDGDAPCRRLKANEAILDAERFWAARRAHYANA